MLSKLAFYFKIALGYNFKSVFLSLFCLMFLVTLPMGLKTQIEKAEASKNFESTTALITKITYKQRVDRIETRSITYEYKYKNYTYKGYESLDIIFHQIPADQFQALKVGMKIPVFVNPTKPSRSRLSIGFSWDQVPWSWYIFLLGLIIAYGVRVYFNYLAYEDDYFDEEQRLEWQNSGRLSWTLQSGTCEFCSKPAPVKPVSFYKNIGMLFQRRQEIARGTSCWSCAANTFLEYTFKTLFLGWWGVISFWVTPFFILGNVLQVILYLVAMLKNRLIS